MILDPKKFAEEWVESWNSHDLERILGHYSDNFEITSPMIKTALGIDSGTLKGKANARKYWQAALAKVPDLKFELIEATKSIDSIAIYYKSVMNKKAVEVMFFDDAGRVARAIAHYN